MRLSRTIAVAFLSAAFGCGGGGGGGDDEMDGSMPRPPDHSKKWDSEKVEDGNVGLHVRLAADNGKCYLAYFATEGVDDGPCVELGATPPQRDLWSLHFAEGTPGNLTVSTVADVLSVASPYGLDLKVDTGGNPVIASVTGAPYVFAVNNGYCGANDVALFERSGDTWTPTTAVVASDEAMTGEAASDFGQIVGYWPALAIKSDNSRFVAYKDVHAGTLQSDDQRRADLEGVFGSGASWNAVPIDWGRGAGDYNRATYDKMDRIVVVYQNGVEAAGADVPGVWVARSEDSGANWEKTRLFGGSTVPGSDLVVDPSSGTLYVAYYDAALRAPVLMTLVDDTKFESVADGWSKETLGDGRYDEGHGISLAVSENGTLALAYRRCVLATAGGTECRPEDDALIFAYRDGDSWKYETVTEGSDSAVCGSYPALAFDGDVARIAYECDASVDDEIESSVYLAGRDTL